MKNINSHEEAKQLLIAGYRLRNIRYSENEWIERRAQHLVSEEGYLFGGFDDEFWQRQLRLPERWYIVEKDKSQHIGDGDSFFLKS